MGLTTNKYGQTVYLPSTTDTVLEKSVESVLAELGLEYEKQFAFDERGKRAIKYDFAVKSNGIVWLLIECDGAPHYKEDFYVSCGNRECRAKAHLVQRHLGDAKKDHIAMMKGIPLLRINEMHKDIVRDLIISYVWEFCDGNEERTKEISMIKMLDKYGWDFDYVPPSEPSKKVNIFLTERGQ